MTVPLQAAKFAKGVLQRAYRMICWRGREEVLILGDSHARVFEDPRMWLRLPRYFLSVVAVDGATAYGLRNRNSKTKALPRFERAIESLRAKFVL